MLEESEWKAGEEEAYVLGQIPRSDAELWRVWSLLERSPCEDLHPLGGRMSLGLQAVNHWLADGWVQMPGEPGPLELLLF